MTLNKNFAQQCIKIIDEKVVNSRLVARFNFRELDRNEARNGLLFLYLTLDLIKNHIET